MSVVNQVERRWLDVQDSDPPVYRGKDQLLQTGAELCQVAGLNFRVFSNLSDVAFYWRALDQSSWHTPFQQYFWNAHLHRTHAGGQRIMPQIVVGFQSGVPKILLPFAIEQKWFSRRLVWLGQRCNDYNAPIIDRRSFPLTDDMYTRIVESISKAHAIDVVHLVDGPVAPDFPSLDLPHGQSIEAGYSSHIVNLSRDWHQTYRRLRSSRSRQRLRSKIKALRLHGRISFRKIRNPVEKSQLARQILDWKTAQLDGMGKRNQFRANQGALNHAILLAINSKVGNLEVFGLFLNGEMIAGMIAFVGGSRFSLFVTAYDPNGPSNYSPGIILLVKTIELSSRAGLGTYDMLVGDEAYKFDWSERAAQICHYLYALNARGAIFCFFVRFWMNLRKWLLVRPWAVSSVRSLYKIRIHAARWRISSVPVSNI